MTMIPITDDTLITSILAGEKRLYEQLIRKYSQRLYRIGMSVIDDEIETRAVMQATFITAFEQLPRLEQRSSFGSWLVKMMLDQCYEKQRQNTPAQTHNDDYNLINMNTVVNESANKDLGNALQQAIENLPDKYRLVFVLRAIEDLSVRDTCSILNIEESNLKIRLNRAKLLLRKDLAPYIKNYVYNFHLSKCDNMVNAVFDRLGISK